MKTGNANLLRNNFSSSVGFMAVKDKKRPEKEKKQAKQKADPSPDPEIVSGIPMSVIEEELERLSTELPVKPETTDKKQEIKRLKAILPSWCDKPWMYITPTHPNQLISWATAWGDYLLEYAEVKSIHFLHLLEIRKEFPFSNQIIKKKLSIEQLQQMGDVLIAKDFGRWWDDRKTRLRIYWRGLDEWSEKIYDWAFQNGYELASIFELANAGELWSTLPKEELIQILKMLESRNLMKWVGKDEKTVMFEF